MCNWCAQRANGSQHTSNGSLFCVFCLDPHVKPNVVRRECLSVWCTVGDWHIANTPRVCSMVAPCRVVDRNRVQCVTITRGVRSIYLACVFFYFFFFCGYLQMKTHWFNVRWSFFFWGILVRPKRWETRHSFKGILGPRRGLLRIGNEWWVILTWKRIDREEKCVLAKLLVNW